MHPPLGILLHRVAKGYNFFLKKSIDKRSSVKVSLNIQLRFAEDRLSVGLLVNTPKTTVSSGIFSIFEVRQTFLQKNFFLKSASVKVLIGIKKSVFVATISILFWP